MRIGIVDLNTRTPSDASANALAFEQQGFDTYWLPGGWRDPLTNIAVAGQNARSIEMGSAVACVYGTHPTAAAETALTVNAALDGRFVFGVGTSHKHMIEGRFGGTFDKPIRQLREYLTIMDSLFTTGAVDYTGEALGAHTELRITGVPRPQVLVAALSDQSLRVAGHLSDGVLATWCTYRLLSEYTIPMVSAAAAEAGRPSPRIVASMPVCVNPDVDAARALAAEEFGVYGTRYTAYKAVFERQGVPGVAPLVITGDENAVIEELKRYGDVGVHDFSANPFGTDEQKQRTTALLGELATSRTL
ncbi:MAG: TIGR03564 family F420-dependent LLM class oxidoreductase [Acidimicrobiia bacterium]